MARQRVRTYLVYTSMDIDPVRSQSQPQAHERRRNAVLRVGGGWSGDVLIVGGEDLENLSAFDVHVERFKPQDAEQEGKLLFPRADGSFILSIFPKPFAAKCPPGETLSKMKKR